jgi:hypothetical protein
MHPDVGKILTPEAPKQVGSAWEQFRNDDRFRSIHNISDREMEMLSRVASLGEVGSPRDFVYVSNTVRLAVRS